MILKDTLDEFELESKKKDRKKSSHSSLFDGLKFNSKKSGSKKSSFYDEKSSFFDDTEFDDLEPFKRASVESKSFSFNWWEYAIIFVELILLIYAILIFLNQVPIF